MLEITRKPSHETREWTTTHGRTVPLKCNGPLALQSRNATLQMSPTIPKIEPHFTSTIFFPSPEKSYHTKKQKEPSSFSRNRRHFVHKFLKEKATIVQPYYYTPLKSHPCCCYNHRIFPTLLPHLHRHHHNALCNDLWLPYVS